MMPIVQTRRHGFLDIKCMRFWRPCIVKCAGIILSSRTGKYMSEIGHSISRVPLSVDASTGPLHCPALHLIQLPMEHWRRFFPTFLPTRRSATHHLHHRYLQVSPLASLASRRPFGSFGFLFRCSHRLLGDSLSSLG